MTWELVVYLIGLFLVMAGFILRNSSIAVFGQIIIVGTVITYLIELSRTFRYLLCDPHHIVDIDSQLH